MTIFYLQSHFFCRLLFYFFFIYFLLLVLQTCTVENYNLGWVTVSVLRKEEVRELSPGRLRRLSHQVGRRPRGPVLKLSCDRCGTRFYSLSHLADVDGKGKMK